MKKDIYIIIRELFGIYYFTINNKFFLSNKKDVSPSIKKTYNSLEILSLFFRFELTASTYSEKYLYNKFFSSLIPKPIFKQI